MSTTVVEFKTYAQQTHPNLTVVHTMQSKTLIRFDITGDLASNLIVFKENCEGWFDKRGYKIDGFKIYDNRPEHKLIMDVYKNKVVRTWCLIFVVAIIMIFIACLALKYHLYITNHLNTTETVKPNVPFTPQIPIRKATVEMPK
jgi:hypothetical protein